MAVSWVPRGCWQAFLLGVGQVAGIFCMEACQVCNEMGKGQVGTLLVDPVGTLGSALEGSERGWRKKYPFMLGIRAHCKPHAMDRHREESAFLRLLLVPPLACQALLAVQTHLMIAD